MKKINLIVIFILISIVSFGQIKVEIHKHMRFKQLNTRSIGQNIAGEGIIEIIADEEDFGKVIELTCVKNCLMTNGKNVIPVENFCVEEKFEKFELKNKTTLIKCFATIDKRKIAKRKIDSRMLEGEYKGAMPLMIAIYEKEKEKIKGEKVE
ncbi:MAG: hypothetical protein ACLVH9_08395 [Fusobacterium sp.]|jgi:hypothetical protein|uniref:hypothetical protein n=1 Tax=Fusobacterium sp. TaxID=68766 RepID=UPI00399C2DCC